MSRSQALRALVTERLTAAAEEIFVLFETTIAEYEQELCLYNEEKERSLEGLRARAGVQISSVSPGSGLYQEITETLQIKEEPEEQSVKQEEQLPVCVPGSSAVCVKREESSLLQQRQTEHQKQGEDIGSETGAYTEHSSDTDNDDHWQPFSCAAARSTGLFPKHKSAPETSASVNDEDLSGAEGAEGKRHQCPVCKKRFGRKDVLQKHIRLHTGERPYSCSICQKTFVQNWTLDLHMKTHTGERPYSCSICEKTFTQKAHLPAHMRLHTGERPYRCSVCSKTFVQKRALTNHMRVHTGVKPYSCPVCQRTFAHWSSLKAHKRTHTGDKPFSCAICGTRFAHSCNLKTHMKIHTGERPYSCTV